MARDGDQRLKSVTLFAAQTDFTEAGELMLFIDDSQVNFLEDMMWEQGYLDSRADGRRVPAAALERPGLVAHRALPAWASASPMRHDLMAWNADATRMPPRMHSEYLLRLFLNNDLAEGHYIAGGRPIALSDIKVPIFSVGTQTDHVAPWRSNHKIHLLTDAEITYVLTTGGHNAGIVSEIGHKHRSFQMLTRPAESHYVDPDSWLAMAPRKEGSWWPALAAWLDQRSGPWVDANRFDDKAGASAGSRARHLRAAGLSGVAVRALARR